MIELLIAEGPKGRLKRSSIEAAAEMKLKREPSDTEFKKVTHSFINYIINRYVGSSLMLFVQVLTEICVTQNSGWVLKSGDGSPT